jgi:alkylhydroperoxidase/carboxymuconolactone decarboxylase family protein YurZ
MAEEDARRQAGLDVLREMGWPETGGVPGMDQEFWQHTVKHLFGDIWGRAGLSLRERELVTLGVLIALDAEGVTPHFKHACKLGFTDREMREVIMQAMYYAGWPRGGAALRRYMNARNAPDSPWRDVPESR